MDDKGRLEDTTLLSDIDSVAGAVSNHTQWVYLSAIIHTKEEDIPIAKVYFRQDVKRYAEETSGFGIVTVMLAKGDFFYRLFPFRDNLEMSITSKFMFKNGKVDEERTRVERFKALYQDKANPSPQMDGDSNRTIEELNGQGIIELEFEIQELFEEAYRLITADGAYVDETTQDILEAACTTRMNKVKIEGKPLVDAIHVEPPHNEEPYGTLIVRRGLMVHELPGWLQERGHGVYSHGIGNFIDRFKEKVTWFVYPLYDFEKRFKDDVEKLVIYFAPEDRYSGIENTYRKEGKVTYIVTTSTPPVTDNARNDELNRGAGFRLTSAKGIMSKPADLTVGVKADYRKLNSEIVNNGRKDQANFARTVGSAHNQYLQVSRILKNEVTFVDLTWNYADTDTIYPGMPCKCIFMNQGIYEERHGTVMATLGVARMVGNPMTSTYHKQDIELKVAMEPINYTPPVQKGGYYGDS